MTWYVYCDSGTGKIVPWNIFEHRSFREEVEQLLSEAFSKSVFDEKLNYIVKYYFWRKCEYEICLATWPNMEIVEKISVYDQIYMNWEKFCRYVWGGEDG